MEINEILDVIEARVELNRPDVKAQAILMGIDGGLNYSIGCVVDSSKITYALLEDISRFNDEANPEAYIQFTEGKIVSTGADSVLFMLMFNVGRC